ncbi:monovalent cation:proton antiporter family protein [Pseudalkalibacillus berkeleyi]|uniref:Monovalent cation:proton antiporter family protein n=1 Tax=Pseudalkalibacillus berkeleyi TaxID=1069813 RepID=A0ABS9GYN7_9BACL|nr:monovalent cation:proton antiporter family protein [Pseudalkalibacillus berkeleyi]MCF6136871.1 monovalent cation:proton antiporter family protein [Pseudalkalibacillus berkeleyi]
MEETHSFMSLLIVVLVAFLTPILLNKLRIKVLPIIVAEIIAGLIIGKTGFDIVEADSLLETLSTLGFIYLLFLSGLEIDFSIFSSKSKKANQNEPNGIMLPIIIFGIMFGFSYGVSWLFVFTGFIDNAFLMSLIIATISLGIVVPTLKDSGIIKSGLGQTILLITVIADLATMILLGVFVSIYSPEGKNTWLLLLLFVAGVILYVIGKYFRNRSSFQSLSSGTIQIDTRAVFTLIIVLVALSQKVGAESILGAFLAGALVSLLSPNPTMVHKLDSFGYGFLIPIFFVMIGVKINLWELFADSQVLLLMPFLLIAFMFVKVIPVLWLKKWYNMKVVMSIGILLSSKLTLVIAAAEIGEKMNMVDSRMSSAIILVGVISSIIGPIFFKKMFPKKTVSEKKTMAIIGANSITLPLSKKMNEQYHVSLYHLKSNKVDQYYSEDHSNEFDVHVIDEFSSGTLQKHKVFEVDILLVATHDDDINTEIALAAKENDVNRIIARIENPDKASALKEESVEVFSKFTSTIMLLEAMIKSPHVMKLFASQDHALSEIVVQNGAHTGKPIKRMEFLGDTIIARIFRDNESIVPHGDTVLKLGDRLIVTGSKESVDRLKSRIYAG